MACGLERSRGKLAEVENRDALLNELRAKQAQDAERYRRRRRRVARSACGGGEKLEKLATAQINDLAMKVRLQIGGRGERGEAAWTAHGWDRVECLIATNAGEPLKPLDEIASGGEMSRVMLALKVTVEEALPRRQGSEGKTRRRRECWCSTRSISALAGGRRRRWEEAEGALKAAAGAVHHAPAADRGVCRPALRDREERRRAGGQDYDPADGGWRAHRRGGPDAERGKNRLTLRGSTRGADAEIGGRGGGLKPLQSLLPKRNTSRFFARTMHLIFLSLVE